MNNIKAWAIVKIKDGRIYNGWTFNTKDDAKIDYNQITKNCKKDYKVVKVSITY